MLITFSFPVYWNFGIPNIIERMSNDWSLLCCSHLEIILLRRDIFTLFCYEISLSGNYNRYTEKRVKFMKKINLYTWSNTDTNNLLSQIFAEP